MSNAFTSSRFRSPRNSSNPLRTRGYFRLALTKRIAGDEFVVVTVRTDSNVFRQPAIGHAKHLNVEIVLPEDPEATERRAN